MFLFFIGLLACFSQDAAITDTSPGESGIADTGSGPLLTVDVLVIGSGPSGLTAAWEAKQAGASVLVLEREPFAGGGSILASNLFAVGTAYQVESGVIDSPALTASEWSNFTGGGDAEDPWVQRLINDSASILNWLIDDLGGEYLGLVHDRGAGSIPRIHSISHGDKHPFHTIIQDLVDETWLHHEATALLQDASGIIGAEVMDLRNGEHAWIAAKETIIATGGFARDDPALFEDRSEIQELLVLYETHHMATGGGLSLLKDANAAWQNSGNYGLYVHATEDPRIGMEREAIWIPRIQEGVIVNRNGQRIGDEFLTHGFGLQHTLLSAPDQRLFLLIPHSSWGRQQFIIPGYNLSGPEDLNRITGQELIDYGTVSVHSETGDLAAAWGMDTSVLQETLTTYNASAAAAFDNEFGKEAMHLYSFEGGPIYSLELYLGAAKAFGGAELDIEGRVLDANGEPIQGLWAAGEAAGMLGTPAVSQGFSGSVTACYLTGQVAGRNAATEALDAK